MVAVGVGSERPYYQWLVRIHAVFPGQMSVRLDPLPVGTSTCFQGGTGTVQHSSSWAQHAPQQMHKPGELTACQSNGFTLKDSSSSTG
jgi:hypothetical protein